MTGFACCRYHLAKTSEAEVRAVKAEARIAELEREVARLKGYTKHKPDCRKWAGNGMFSNARLYNGYDCTCGLDGEARMKGVGE